jgi:Na+-driven multidrug efflux pump
MKKINKKYTTILFGLFMGSFTSCIISAVLVFLGNGPENFLVHWIKEWMIAICLAVPIATFIPPIIRRGIDIITED